MHGAIGTPFPNYVVYILGEDLLPAPVRWLGEVCIGGAGVSKGYPKEHIGKGVSFVEELSTT